MPSFSAVAGALLSFRSHWGHGRKRQNPKMRQYLHASKGNVAIIEVRETIKGLVKAYHFIKNLAARKHTIVFVGTKRAARSVIRAQAERCGVPYVNQRWLGGTLTNFETILKRLTRLSELSQPEASRRLNSRAKQEQSSGIREKRKLLRRLDGLQSMDSLPSALLVVDPGHESKAVHEATKIGAATVALIDSDGDPEGIDIVIPVNDDSAKVVGMIVGTLADAVIEGRRSTLPPPSERGRSGNGPRPPGNLGPGMSNVPSRLRPRPTPGSASAKRKLK